MNKSHEFADQIRAEWRQEAEKRGLYIDRDQKLSASKEDNMELKELITHARSVAENSDCDAHTCAYQHDRLVDYLEELQRYRDTGLEPEEVKDMAEKAETSLLTWFESRYGFPVGKLMDLLEAKQQGRLSIQLAVPGQLVYIVERDEDGEACDVSGCMFLAQVNQAVIVSAFINDSDDLDETLLCHIEETAREYNTDLSVFPISDCYLSKEEAHSVLEGGNGDG